VFNYSRIISQSSKNYKFLLKMYTKNLKIKNNMPQLTPFYYMNEVMFAFLIILFSLFLLSKYILPRIVRLFISRMFISKI
jgi:F-type H+-transporting ATPase subunit 8